MQDSKSYKNNSEERFCDLFKMPLILFMSDLFI